MNLYTNVIHTYFIKIVMNFDIKCYEFKMIKGLQYHTHLIKMCIIAFPSYMFTTTFMGLALNLNLIEYL